MDQVGSVVNDDGSRPGREDEDEWVGLNKEKAAESELQFSR